MTGPGRCNRAGFVGGGALGKRNGGRVLWRSNPRQLGYRVGMPWHPYDGPSPLGEFGTEGGRLIRDEYHEDGVRISLEDCTVTGGVAPYAITCGGPSGLVHTAFFDTRDEAEAAYAGMQRDLVALANIDHEASLYEAIEAFVSRY